MVYRKMYWGLLTIGPSEMNAMTEALMPRSYLIKIVSPIDYATHEEALREKLEYGFLVTDEEPILIGMSGSGKDWEDGEAVDVLTWEDWPRYQMIRLKSSAAKTDHKDFEELAKGAVPCSDEWKWMFPAYGCYRVENVAFSVVGLPFVDMDVKLSNDAMDKND